MLTTIRSLVDKFFGDNEEQHSLVSNSEEMKTIEVELEKIQSSAFEKTSSDVINQHVTDFLHKGYYPALNEDVSNAVKTLLEYNPTAIATVLEYFQSTKQTTTSQVPTALPSHLSLRSAAEQSFLSSL
ncbi:MAG: hypothetical protein JNL36_06185 [Candidatus Kapabacteria bacterium]|nr:hypothetical protein [Candidatus Kapabacteria bacterium]